MNDLPWLSHYDRDVPAHLSYPAIALQELLREAARKFHEQPCIYFQGSQVTYSQLDRLSDVLARALLNIGIQKGQPVGLMLPNIPQFVAVFYAILKAGGVVVAINPNYRVRELEFQLGDAGVTLLFGVESSRELIESLDTDLRPRICIYTSLDESVSMAEWLSPPLEDQKAVRSDTREEYQLKDLACGFIGDERPLVEVNPNDPAIYQYSGGTTGTPKAAIGLHRNLVANTLQFRAWLNALQAGQETFLTAIPLYHVYGIVIGMSVGISMGAGLVLIADARNVSEILQSIEQYRATFFPGVPGMYHAINQHPDVLAGKYDLRSIKACISGSAPLLRHIKERFEALTGGKLVEGYGLSEAPTASHCNPINGENRSGSIGLPLPDVEAGIMDLETGTVHLSPGEIGELVFRGPQVMAGYHGQVDEADRILRDGWLYTGDIARMDSDGYFYIVDRKKELIKVGGFQVWPREIEEVISLHQAVQEVAVAGVPDVQRGEVVKAWVVRKSGQSINAEDIQALCREQLARYKVPTLVDFCAVLPRTGVGKLLRRELVRQHIELYGNGSKPE